MNILDNYQNSKLISKILKEIGLDEVPSNFNQNTDFLRKAKWGLCIPANDNIKNKSLNNQINIYK